MKHGNLLERARSEWNCTNEKDFENGSDSG